MARMSKQEKQELRRPDRLQQQFAKGLRWYDTNRKTFWLALIVTLGLVLAAIATNYFYNQISSKDRDALAEIDMIQTKSNLAWAKEQQANQKALAELQTKIDAAKKDSKEFADLTKQKVDLEKKMEGEPNHAEAGAAYLKYFEAHKTKPTGWIAGVRAADELVKKKDYQKAREVLEVVVNNGQGNEFYNVQVRLMLVGLQQQTGDYEAALKTLAVLDNSVSKELKPMVLLYRGRLYMGKNDVANAKKQFDDIVKNHGSTEEARTARGLMALL